jgi:hypothetical protein
MFNNIKGKRDKWKKCYISHFNKYLGKAKLIEAFEQDKNNPSIDIISYVNVFGGCRAFCTIGLSSYKDVVGQYAEIFMPIDRAWDETPQILASTLFNRIQNKQRIGWGLSIRFADVFPEFVKKYSKSAIYFTIPYDVPEGLNKVVCGKNEGFVYLAFYISEGEYQYFIKHGTEKFDSLLEKENADMFNLLRPSVA